MNVLKKIWLWLLLYPNYNCSVLDNSPLINPQTAVLEGVSVSLLCEEDENNLWFFNSLQKEPVMKSKVVTLYSVHEVDVGNYYCFGKYPNSDQYFLAATRLQVVRKL